MEKMCQSAINAALHVSLFQHECITTFYALVFLLQQLVPFLFFSPLPSDSLGPPLVPAAGSVSEVRQALVQKPTPKQYPHFQSQEE